MIENQSGLKCSVLKKRSESESFSDCEWNQISKELSESNNGLTEKNSNIQKGIQIWVAHGNH